MPLRLQSFIGLAVLIACAWALSNNRRAFPWRAVLWGLALQFGFALFILKTPFGAALFSGAQDLVQHLNDFATEGAKFVFGPLADEKKLGTAFGAGATMVFAIIVSATIILISALSSLLYHWGVLQRVVAGMAWVMQKAMRLSGSESLAGASNIFLGQTEAALLIKPYLAKMTQSEIIDRKSTRLNSSHVVTSRMPSSA